MIAISTRERLLKKFHPVLTSLREYGLADKYPVSYKRAGVFIPIHIRIARPMSDIDVGIETSCSQRALQVHSLETYESRALEDTL